MYNFSAQDIEDIQNFTGEAYDESIVSCIYDNLGECGRGEARMFGNIPTYMDPYVDYAAFAENLVGGGDRYLQLDDGRIVVLNL